MAETTNNESPNQSSTQPVEQTPVHKSRGQKLNDLGKRLNALGNAFGIAAVLFIVGVFTFPFGIIAWIFALSILVAAWNKALDE